MRCAAAPTWMRVPALLLHDRRAMHELEHDSQTGQVDNREPEHRQLLAPTCNARLNAASAVWFVSSEQHRPPIAPLVEGLVRREKQTAVEDGDDHTKDEVGDPQQHHRL